MATNPFGAPGTQDDTVYQQYGKTSFEDALRQISSSLATNSATAASQPSPSTLGTNVYIGGGVNPAAASLGGLSTTTQPIGSNPYGTAAHVGAQLGGPAGPLGTGPSAPGAGTNAALGNAATQQQGKAQTAFGQSFDPAAYGMAWDNPKAMIQSYFNFNKMPLHSGGEAMAQQGADSMKLLFALLNGSSGAGNLDFGKYLDWSGKYLQNSMTPGGSYASPQQVIRSIVHADPKSPVFNLYYGADLTPDQQVGNVLSGLRYGLQQSMPAPMLASVLSRAQELGNGFMAWRMTHPDGGYTFGDYLRQQDPQTFGAL